MNFVGRWILAIISVLILTASAYLHMEALAIAALVSLAFAVLQPETVQSLSERLRKAGPFEFEAPVRKALKAIPEDERPRVEQEARETIARFGRDMAVNRRFANMVSAELAALGVRMTAVELYLNALRSQLSYQSERTRSPSPLARG